MVSQGKEDCNRKRKKSQRHLGHLVIVIEFCLIFDQVSSARDGVAHEQIDCALRLGEVLDGDAFQDSLEE